jgi:hypothetical protein
LLIETIIGYLDRGYVIADIAVLSGKGRERSELAAISHIGDFALRKFTGDYTEDGKQIYTEGELELDSIYRYKVSVHFKTQLYHCPLLAIFLPHSAGEMPCKPLTPLSPENLA